MEENTRVVEKGQLIHIKDIAVGSVVLEISAKRDPGTDKVFFALTTVRKFNTREGQESRGKYLQQRDIRDVMRALLDAEDWISEAHRNARNNDGFYECLQGTGLE
jgi:hypothetical protein